ncbi:hypothetical protein LUZ60_002400 [Juncus effusus]|nr:hypothetical protein LUZ60_002400 [Juncus effusus]
MAHAIYSPRLAVPPLVSGERKRSGSMQLRRRLELEKEVAELQKTLEDEKKVHEILERALLPNSFQFILQIPGFLPKKAKELLAELVLVEEEIGRLENQIQIIRGGLREIKTNPNPNTDHEMQEKVAKEMKAMFFINKAIKEDQYSNLNLNSKSGPHSFEFKGRRSMEKVQEEKGSPRYLMRKEHTSPRKSGILAKPAFVDLSPKRALEKPTGANAEKLLKIFQEPSETAVSKKTDSQKFQFQPNKLSERILKCLICIFQRLLRTSKLAEQEKSNNISRKSSPLFNKPLISRIEPSTNLKAGRQDPYGVFEIEDSILRDIGAYKNLVRFSASSLDMKGFSASSLLFNKLRDLMDALQQVDLRVLSHNQKLAFWINVYNACIMNGFLQNGLPSNSEKLLTIKNKSVVNVGGIKLTASEIEYSILRQPSKMRDLRKEILKGEKEYEKEIMIQNLYGMEKEEQNLIFAVCCGTKSSPALRIYTPERITTELEKSKLDYLQASLVLTSTKRLMIPNLIYSNLMDEFANNLDLLLQWIINQLPTSWPLRKSMVECVKLQNRLHIEIMPYNDEYQYLLSM